MGYQLIRALIFLTFIGGVFPACSQKTYKEQMDGLLKGTVPLIGAQQLDSLNRNEVPLYLLDTRMLKEQATSHIDGAQFIEYDEFDKKDVVKIPKDAKVVVYCTAGYRSERIGEKLLKLGYTEVYNLYGGIIDWKNNGLEVYNLVEQKTDSVHTYNSGWSRWLYKGVKVYD